MSPPTPEVAQRIAAHKLEHWEYSKARHKRLMELFAEKGSGLAFLVPDQLGARCLYFGYRWSTAASNAYLTSGTLPAQITDLQDDAPVSLVFARMDATFPDPLYAHDVGKPDFLHATHGSPGTMVAFIVERVGAVDPEEHLYMIPGPFLDTAETREINDRYLRTGIKQQDVVRLNYAADLNQFRGGGVPQRG